MLKFDASKYLPTTLKKSQRTKSLTPQSVDPNVE